MVGRKKLTRQEMVEADGRDPTVSAKLNKKIGVLGVGRN
jgi:hypothetical protein